MQRRKCPFCKNNTKIIDYRAQNTMSSSISGWAKIKPRKDTNCCPKHQRRLSQAILRARYMGLLPYTSR